MNCSDKDLWTSNSNVVLFKMWVCDLSPHSSSCKWPLFPSRGRGRGKTAAQSSESHLCRGMGVLFSCEGSCQAVPASGELCRLLGFHFNYARNFFPAIGSSAKWSAELPRAPQTLALAWHDPWESENHPPFSCRGTILRIRSLLQLLSCKDLGRTEH